MSVCYPDLLPVAVSATAPPNEDDPEINKISRACVLCSDGTPIPDSQNHIRLACDHRAHIKCAFRTKKVSLPCAENNWCRACATLSTEYGIEKGHRDPSLRESVIFAELNDRHLTKFKRNFRALIDSDEPLDNAIIRKIVGKPRSLVHSILGTKFMQPTDDVEELPVLQQLQEAGRTLDDIFDACPSVDYADLNRCGIITISELASIGFDPATHLAYEYQKRLPKFALIQYAGLQWGHVAGISPKLFAKLKFSVKELATLGATAPLMIEIGFTRETLSALGILQSDLIKYLGFNHALFTAMGIDLQFISKSRVWKREMQKSMSSQARGKN